VLPGVVGTIQATETIKLIIGQGDPLIGRLLLFDALQMKFRTLKLQRDVECPVCGDHPTVTKLIDYEQFCGITPPPKHQPATPAGFDITVHELKTKLDKGEVWLLDVLEPAEWAINHIEGATLIPLGELPKRLAEVPNGPGAPDIVVQCKTGVRSAKAANFLKSKGWTRVQNLKGGIAEWIARIDPSQPTY